MALPKEPRQKMINLMYLVLTALLAMNVSSEILNAFKTVKSSLDNSSTLASSKTTQLFTSFQKKMEDPKTKEKATIWFEKANEAHKMAEVAFKYVEDLKLELMKEAGYNPPKDTLFKEDNLEASTRLLVEPAPHGKGKGKDLYKKLEDFKNSLLGIDSAVKEELGKSLPIDLTMPKTQNAGNNTWEAAYFRMTPTIAALTILSKFQNDIRNAEAQVVELCHKKIGEVEIVYDQFKAIANASASYVMPDEEIVINAGVGAFSSAAKPSVTIDGAGAQALPDGSYEYKFKAPAAAGEYTKKVRVSFVKPDGTSATVDKDIKYTVGQPAGLAVSTDKTRVFYQGCPNEVTVVGSGGAEKISLDIQGPGVVVSKKGNGLYLVECPSTGVAKLTATDGKGKPITLTIPIKPVPPPVIKVGSITPGPVAANVFKAQRGLQAELKDFVFEGVTYTVASFTIVATGVGFEEVGFQNASSTSNSMMVPDVQNLLKKCVAGTTVIIDDIKVIGPGGVRKSIEGNVSYVLE